MSDDHHNGEPGRHRRVDAAGRRRPRQCVSAQEIADRGGEDFDPRRNPVERRCERIAETSRGYSNEDGLTAQGLRIEVAAQELSGAVSSEASSRPVVADGQMVAQVCLGCSAPELDPSGTKHRVGSNTGGRDGQREGRRDAVGNFEDHGNVSRNSARVGRHVRKPRLRRVANRVGRPENLGRLGRQRQLGRLRLSACTYTLAEDADRCDDARGRLQSLGELRILVLAFGIRECDIQGDSPRMQVRNGAHEPRQHRSRQAVALGFAQRLVVDRDNDDSVRRRTRARQKKPPVEGQIFDPVQTGGYAHHLSKAEPGAEHEGRRDEAAGQQP